MGHDKKRPRPADSSFEQDDDRVGNSRLRHLVFISQGINEEDGSLLSSYSSILLAEQRLWFSDCKVGEIIRDFTLML